MRHLTPLLLLAPFVVLACSTKPSPPPRTVDPAVQVEIAEQVRLRDGLMAKLVAADQKLRQSCEFQVGDCLLTSAEQRDAILDPERFPECNAVPSGESERCVEERLLSTGGSRELRAFHQDENRCLTGIAECITRLEDRAANDERQRVIAERRGQIEALPAVTEQQQELTLWEGRLEYVRGTLPPDADGVCSELPERAACETKAAAMGEEVDALLAADEGSYSQEAVLAALTRHTVAAAACPAVELACLNQTLTGYGGTSQTVAAQEKVFDLLAQRQRLRAALSPRTAKSCIDVSLAQDMPRVVESYRQFARQRGEYFLLQLNNSFAALYRKENACLTRLGDAKRERVTVK
ncbi:MAG: hypothetical protein JW751_03040 [Polyangiaceae bacterium]|nr:hypothetical protein [Polyangiaceae bacterium]